MSAFSVEATIRLRDEASKDVKGLNKTLNTLFKTVQKLNAAPAGGIANAADGLAALRERAKAMGGTLEAALVPLIVQVVTENLQKAAA